MSENLPVPENNLCRGLTNKGEPCKGSREPGSDFCYRHQPREATVGSPAETPPFPGLPSREELATPEGVRTFVYDILEYIGKHDGAQLKRVYAMRQFTDPLLRSVDMAAIQAELAEARGEVDRLTRARDELKYALDGEREQHRRITARGEWEKTRLREENARLTERNGELESRPVERQGAPGNAFTSMVANLLQRTPAERASTGCDHAHDHDHEHEREHEPAPGEREDPGSEGLQEELESLLEEQHAKREAAEKALADTLNRLRRIHRSLCFDCAERVRPVIGGEPEFGDADYRRERREYIGRSR